MTDTKHTPGPWIHYGKVTLVDDTYSLFCGGVNPVRGHYIGDICSIQSCDHIDGVPREDAEANARLIAAAPDLLAALEAVEDDGCWNEFTKGTQDQILAAILKATT